MKELISALLGSSRISASHDQPFEFRTEPMTILPIYREELFTTTPLLRHNPTLIIIVFFLLVFVLLFLILLMVLAMCRRKLRRHFKAELARQRSQHYYYHHPKAVHQPSITVTDSNRTVGTNDSLYEQLPSLSSDSEQPFLYNDKKLPSAPALPPHPASFRQHLCCHPPPPSSHEYQCVTNTSTITDYSIPNSQQQQQHRCSAVLVWPNQLLYPNPYECYRTHPYPAEYYHRRDQPLESSMIRSCHNERHFQPAASVCRCHSHMQSTDTYIYPCVHR